MYFFLLGGVEPTTILDENEQKEFVCLCAKYIYAVYQHTSKAVD